MPTRFCDAHYWLSGQPCPICEYVKLESELATLRATVREVAKSATPVTAGSNFMIFHKDKLAALVELGKVQACNCGTCAHWDFVQEDFGLCVYHDKQMTLKCMACPHWQAIEDETMVRGKEQ